MERHLSNGAIVLQAPSSVLMSIRIAQQAEEKLHVYLKEQDLTFSKINDFLAQYRSACGKVILQGFESTVRNDIEIRLWKSHGKVNNFFRKELRQFKVGPGKKRPVEKRKTEKHFLEFIKSSQRFYRGIIQQLASTHNGLPELEAIANRLMLSTLPMKKPHKTSELPNVSVLLLCHRTLIQLGDLSRWRETELVTKGHNWGPASAYYDLARDVYPSAGAPYNQLAVIDRAENNHLQSIYHLYRALAVEQPHPGADGNLGMEFQKVREATIENKIASSDDEEGLLKCFLRLHAGCYNDSGCEISELMGKLVTAFRENSLKSNHNELILINIAAMYHAEARLKNTFAGVREENTLHDPDSTELAQSYYSCLQVNVITFSTILQVLIFELQQLLCNDLRKRDNRSGSGSTDLTANIRHLLPGLRHYSSWVLSNSRMLATEPGKAALKMQISGLWKLYAEALTLLISAFPVSGLPPSIEYLLEEDEDTIGFEPLDNKLASRRYCNTSTGYRKPKWHNRGVHRQHSNDEMLGRIRDFITDGVVISNQQGVPIRMVDTTFAYVDDRQASNDGFYNVPVSTGADITHIDETTFSQNPNSLNTDGLQLESTSVSTQSKSKPASSSANEAGNEAGNDTTYGLFGTSTASEIEAQAGLQNRPLVTPSLLPSSTGGSDGCPFAPKPGGAPSDPRPAAARHLKSNHLQRRPDVMIASPEFGRVIESSQSSIPEPTNPNPIMPGDYRNHPYINAKFPTHTNYTTGQRSSTVYGNDDFHFDESHFISPTVDFGCSGSVTGATNLQTPPSGQGTG
ncbi:hypothetical protein ACLMJK_009645 [Lecanora helva]